MAFKNDFTSFPAFCLFGNDNDTGEKSRVIYQCSITLLAFPQFLGGRVRSNGEISGLMFGFVLINHSWGVHRDPVWCSGWRGLFM